MRTAATFALAALRYWGRVFPRSSRLLRRLRRRAGQIGDPALRELALEALAKRSNIEGAAAFAAFVPRRRRHAAIEALALYQAIYNYADTLAEQPHPDPPRNARQLHGALLDALRAPGTPLRDYYARDAHAAGDGGYLAELVCDCRARIAELPGFGDELAALAERAAERIVCFQGLDARGPHSPLERWAEGQAPAGGVLTWWELAGAAGSSLLVHVAIAAAARSAKWDRGEAARIEDACFPWVGALHSLLDSAVDEREDAFAGQLSLIGCYADDAHARARLRWLAGEAAGRARSLPGGTTLLAAMVASYLSELERAGAAHELREALREPLGWPLGAAMLVFRVRRLLGSARHEPAGQGRAYGHGRAFAESGAFGQGGAFAQGGLPVAFAQGGAPAPSPRHVPREPVPTLEDA